MIKIYTIVLLVISLNAFSQTTQTDKVIESGKLLLDIFKTVKNSGANDPKTNENKINKTESKSNTIKNICFYNPTDKRITIELTTIEAIKKQICNASIPSNDSTCCYNINKSIYHIKITEAGNSTNVIKENDINLTEIIAEELKIIIK